MQIRKFKSVRQGQIVVEVPYFVEVDENEYLKDLENKKQIMQERESLMKKIDEEKKAYAKSKMLGICELKFDFAVHFDSCKYKAGTKFYFIKETEKGIQLADEFGRVENWCPKKIFNIVERF